MTAVSEATYRHEAGHAIAAATMLTGSILESVVVLGAHEGWTRYRVPTDADPADRAVVMLAGRAAARAAGFDLHRADGRDQHQAFAFALEAARWPRFGDPALAEADLILADAAERAAALVTAQSFTIAEFAARLREGGGRLAGRDLRFALGVSLSLGAHARRAPGVTATVARPAAAAATSSGHSHAEAPLDARPLRHRDCAACYPESIPPAAAAATRPRSIPVTRTAAAITDAQLARQLCAGLARARGW